MVGAVNTLTGIAIMVALAYLAFHYIVYTGVAYFVAFIVSYVLNGLFTFRGSRITYQRFLLFVASNGTLLLFVEGLQVFLIELLQVRELLGVALGMATYTLVGFVLNRRVVYRVA